MSKRGGERSPPCHLVPVLSIDLQYIFQNVLVSTDVYYIIYIYHETNFIELYKIRTIWNINLHRWKCWSLKWLHIKTHLTSWHLDEPRPATPPLPPGDLWNMDPELWVDQHRIPVSPLSGASCPACYLTVALETLRIWSLWPAVHRTSTW